MTRDTAASTCSDHPFLARLITQLRSQDHYGRKDSWPDEKILEPLILSKEQRMALPTVANPDQAKLDQLAAWYNTLAEIIEQRTGLLAVPLLNVSQEGFGRALITVGKLVVIDNALRDVHRFGFPSVEKLCSKAEMLIDRACGLIEKHAAAAND